MFIVFDILRWFATPLADSLCSAGSGLLTCVSTWTILSALRRILRRGKLKQEKSAVVYGMAACSVLAGVAVLLFVHALLDGYVEWYYAPLGPPLELVVP